ncbi:MAG: glycosyl hydrolase family 28-related protein, partial [Verrucomicrobiota bacterium]
IVHPQLIVDYTGGAVDYTEWSFGWGDDIGTQTEDFDGDGLSNVREFGLGGDPADALNQGTFPIFEVLNDGGSNVVRYIHPQLSHPGSALDYSVETCTDLTGGAWSNDGIAVAGIDVTGGALDFVTNTTSMVADQKFIRLAIDDLSNTFNVKDYGAQGNGSADDTSAILAAIAAADASGSFADVVFPAGSYRIESGNEHALELANLSDVRLRGCGTNSVLLVSDPENGCIAFTDCANIAVQGFTVDYETPPFAQGTIVAVNTAAGTYDLQIDPGYPELSHPAFSNAQSRWGITVDLASEAYGLWAYFSSNWTSLGSRTWRMTADDPAYLQAHPLSVGDRFVHMARTFYDFAVMAESCSGITIKDVSVYASAGLTTGFFHCSGVKVDGLVVGLKPGSNRLLSTNGDCVHAGGCTDGLLIENCHFEGMPDDGINIHGRSGLVISNVTDTVKWIGMQRPAIYAIDDVVQFMNNTEGGIRGTAILTSAVKLNDYVWEITLDTPMPDLMADIAWVDCDKFNDLSRCGQGSIIRNNFVGSHRGRETVLSTHDVVVTNNHFFNPSLSWNSLSLENNYKYYSEGPGCYNVTIADNTFEGGTNRWSWSAAAVGIHNQLNFSWDPTPTYDSWNIEIRGNTFINIDGTAVTATSATDVRIIDNNMVDTDYGIKVASSPVVMLEHADDIQIDNLDIVDLNSATYAGVHIKNSVPTGGVVTNNLTAVLAAGKPVVLDDR